MYKYICHGIFIRKTTTYIHDRKKCLNINKSSFCFTNKMFVTCKYRDIIKMIVYLLLERNFKVVSKISIILICKLYVLLLIILLGKNIESCRHIFYSFFIETCCCFYFKIVYLFYFGFFSSKTFCVLRGKYVNVWKGKRRNVQVCDVGKVNINDYWMNKFNCFSETMLLYVLTYIFGNTQFQ